MLFLWIEFSFVKGKITMSISGEEWVLKEFEGSRTLCRILAKHFGQQVSQGRWERLWDL